MKVVRELRAYSLQPGMDLIGYETYPTAPKSPRTYARVPHLIVRSVGPARPTGVFVGEVPYWAGGVVLVTAQHADGEEEQLVMPANTMVKILVEKYTRIYSRRRTG